jgi:hypothetical protein
MRKAQDPFMTADGRCRYCGKTLPSNRKYFCPFDEVSDRLAVKQGLVYKTCSSKFAEEYESPFDGDLPAPQFLMPECNAEAVIHAEAVAFAEWAADQSLHKTNPECRQCQHDCKVWKPVDDTPTTLICKKTRPELFA